MSVWQDIGIGPEPDKLQPLVCIAGPVRVLLQDGSPPDQGLSPEVEQLPLLSSDNGPAEDDYGFLGTPWAGTELGPGLSPGNEICNCPAEVLAPAPMGCREEDMIVSLPSTLHGIRFAMVC